MLNPSRPLLLLLLCSYVLADYYDEKYFDKADKNDFMSYLQNILKNLGVQETFNNANTYIKKKIDEAQKYDNFQEDWRKLKSEPVNGMNIVDFMRNTTLPVVINACAIVRKGCRNCYLEIMRFTREKCDRFLGEKAPLHPWNVIKQDSETVSFLVLIYSSCLALILFKLCSLWNFVGWLTFGYLTYVLAGPHWCFRWLVFTTGIFWYLFDLILQYPFHMAVLFLVFYSSTYLTSLPQMFRRSSTPRFVSVPETPAASEFKYLKGKMNQIEEKTDGIQKKVEELEILFKSMAFGKDL